ncbi:MAG: DNA primase, partial [Candidatus Competibacteraceae bacterium]|nr:DNA primase [Candidatus Competibacteraceae bacterium]
MRDLLAALGFKPVKEDKGELWYLSPFRQETDASFKITRDGKAWYDHGEGAGGNILKFACRYYGLADQDIRG